MPLHLRFITAILLLFLSGFGLSNHKSKLGLNITYIGNEGILIEAGNQQVVIDGIHDKYLMYTALDTAATQRFAKCAKAF